MSPAVSTTHPPAMQTFRVSKQSGRFGSPTSASQQIDQRNMVFPAVRDFVDFFAEEPSKRRYIKKILVATNGIAAVKCILSMRKLLMQLFKEDRIIKFICLTTEQEIQSKAEYLKMADYIVFSPAGANTNNYANVDEIVEHAVRNEVDAVWAGWGHASENPRLPEELSRHNITFIGPPSKAMFALGDKIASTIIAQTVGIPTIDWSGSGLTAPEPESADEEVSIPKELYLGACVSSVDEGLRKLREKNITYPIMIKASEGGGGKGIRRCNNDDEFKLNFHRVEVEVPGSPIFLMKCMENARHIEVQLIGDEYGNVIPIFSRDCSIQRRCQKIIEEAPAGIVPEHILHQMQQDAVNLAKKVGYVSAGTVEYMYQPSVQKYYFLELNPRLQVEHPCTEMVANINIPAVQLQVAMGIPLHRIVEIRLFFGLDRYGTSQLPEDQIRTDTNICVIAARITSEDPAEGFRPASGAVEVLNFQSNQNVWGYFSVASAGKVHEYADSQFGHLFAKGTTRYEAISALLCALKELELRATFTSQVNYLVGLLHDAEFENNQFHTGWLDARIASKVQSAPELPLHVTIAIGATVIGYTRIQEVFSKFQTALERGQILPKSELTETWEVELVHKNVKYSVLVNRYGPINFMVCLNESEICTEVRDLGNGTLLVTYSDHAYTCHLEEETERFKVCIGRTLTIFEKENDPSMLRSRNAGRLLQYLKKDGEQVSVGEIYAEIESMKMVINLEVKKAGGRLIQVAQPGQVLFPGTLIARLDAQGDISAAKPTLYSQRIPEWDRAQEQSSASKTRLDTKFANLLQSCRDILSGFSVPETIFKQYARKLVDELFDTLHNPRLPYALFKVMLNVVETRISRISTYDHIKELIRSEDNFPALALTDEMEGYLSTVDPSELGIEKNYFESLLRICERFEGGLEGHTKIIVGELLESFLDTERYFQDVSYDQGVSNIKADIADTNRVVRMVYSHTRITAQNMFLRELISRLDQSLIVELQPVLKKLANLFNTEIEPLALYVRQVLNKIHQTSYDDACTNLLTRKGSERSLSELVAACSQDGGDNLLKEFVDSCNGDHASYLHEFFFTPNSETNKCAIKLFIQKNFHVKESDIQILPTGGGGSGKPLIFKFEVPTLSYATNKRRQQHHNGVKNGVCREIYFLSVLSELDSLRQRSLAETLKAHSERDCNNTFLFVAYPKGENGFSQSIALPESELKVLGAQLRDELDVALTKSGVSHQGGVDLMLSRPSHAPIYTQYDFSAKEKLELYRLPDGVEDVSVPNSPYLLFKYNDRGVFRLFVRCLLRDMKSTFAVDKYCRLTPAELLRQKLVDVLDGACGELRVYSASDKSTKAPSNAYDCNHVFLRLDYDPELKTDGWWHAAQQAVEQCQKYLVKHRVTKVEIIYQQPPSPPLAAIGTSRPEMTRLVYMNETGAIPDICAYRVDENDRLQPLVNGHARLTGQSCYAPHQSILQVHVQKKRYLASKLSTTYVYDYPIMFGRAALEQWRSFEHSDPKSYHQLVERMSPQLRDALRDGDDKRFARAYEMILASGEEGDIDVCRDEAELSSRAEMGSNDRGMVAWEMELCTPDAPEGRKVVVIANDITYAMGSFSMREHRLYHKASEYSRRNKMPRVYIAANSGARIGFAADVKKRLQVVWNDEERPEDGFQYLAVQCDGNEVEDAKLLAQIESAPCPGGAKNQTQNPHLRRIQAVIGKENDIGVENLVGSGLIAGETSAAYREVPTYCLVTGRSVGIGAYVARLSHRICQVDSSHIILTGAPALNSVLGREIYTSNSQLGGPQIMYRNGVSHSVVTNDLDGVRTLLKWISYLPAPRSDLGGMLKDDQQRLVSTQPTKSAYDPRAILDPLGGGGLFDAGTFDEIMSGWAKTIIAGRARLCGIPVGVVAVETRTVECELPADPAAQDSQARVVFQAGQVWYPDSAYKTAEAINDFNHEGLPLIVLANIRGFSGGQKDMFEMVLKFGACIVDALQAYTQPIVVYLPPYGELRGGAWAVLDTQINPTCITMLADPECRGGVLEASGIVEIKFREKDLHVLMSRSDAQLRALEGTIDDDGAAPPKHPVMSKEQKEAVQAEITKRRERLMPICRTAAVKFADLHDTTARMLAKGAINDEVAWQHSRIYFHRLFQVEGAKLTMARRYLNAGTAHADGSNNSAGHSVLIEELSKGYKWVERHLAEMGISVTQRATTSNSNKLEANTAALKASKRTRYEYTPEPVVRYAESAEFHHVLEQLAVERARTQLMRNLDNSHDDSTKRSVVREILSQSSPTLQREVMLDQLRSMSATERRQLLRSLN